MNLLIFFALPLATILLAIVLQKQLKSPILVGITFFAVYIIVAFILSIIGIVDLGPALVAAIIYTIIAFITAYIVMIICNILKKIERICRHREDHESDVESENDNNNNGCCCSNNQNNNVAVQGVIEVQNNNNENESNGNCNCDNNNNCGNDRYDIRANVSPNITNNGRTGTFRGCYRRR